MRGTIAIRVQLNHGLLHWTAIGVAQAVNKRTGPTIERLNHDVDRGRGGNKVNVIDPAAAPLGSDEEAAGTPLAAEAVAKAHEEEIVSAPARSERDGGAGPVVVYASLILAIGAVLISGILLVR
jgi:hypothetical protein